MMQEKTNQIVSRLRSLANPAAAAGMARFGISSTNTLGISIPALRQIARETGKDHRLALDLWHTGIHEARILAAMVDEVGQVTEAQADAWVRDFDSWDVCDQVCSNLLDKTPFAHGKAMEWSRREEEFVKRAGFVMMACLAVHDKSAKDADFIKFFPRIKAGASDERNFVKKAVNWALRQIGKRDRFLRDKALALAGEIQQMDSRAARWVAADAIRELEKRPARDQ